MKTEKELVEETRNQLVDRSTGLKQLLVDYVGNLLSPDDDKVTLEMIVKVVAAEFPEVVLGIAEENFLRGYHQGLADVDKWRSETSSENPQSE